MKSWLKVKSSQVEAGSNIAQNNSSRLLEVISDHNLPKFTRKVDQIEIKSSWIQFEHGSESLI